MSNLHFQVKKLTRMQGEALGAGPSTVADCERGEFLVARRQARLLATYIRMFTFLRNESVWSLIDYRQFFVKS